MLLVDPYIKNLFRDGIMKLRALVAILFLLATAACTNVASNTLTENYEKVLQGKADPIGRRFKIMMGVRKVTGWEPTDNYSIKIIDSGTGIYENRLLSAEIVSLDMEFVNKEKALYERECIYTTLLDDVEFGYFRNLTGGKCDEIQKEIPKWKEKVKFEHSSVAVNWVQSNWWIILLITLIPTLFFIKLKYEDWKFKSNMIDKTLVLFDDIEELYEITFTNDQLENIETVGQLYYLIHQNVQGDLSVDQIRGHLKEIVSTYYFCENDVSDERSLLDR